jgi:hypothetical protein
MSFLRRCVFAGIALLCVTAVAFADEVPLRTFGISWQRRTPAVSFSAGDLLRGTSARKLQSGLPQMIVMRLYAYADGDEPVAVAARSCRVVFDLWDEVYRVELVSIEGRASFSLRSLAEVEQRCVVARNLPLGDDSRWTPKSGRSAYFAAVIEFNPMSAGTVERIRRWLSRPPSGRVESDAFFGSFVSVFVNHRVGGAERVVRFRSQTVSVP